MKLIDARALFTSLLVLFPMALQAQVWPAQSVKIIVPFTPERAWTPSPVPWHHVSVNGSDSR
jgi:hypothetical protein